MAVTSRSKDRIAAAAEAVGAAGLVWDSADLDDVPALVASVADALGGPVDVLVCNTGGPPAGPDPLAFSREDWEAAHRSLGARADGAGGRRAAGDARAGWGRVLNVGSTSVREPLPHLVLSNAERSAALAAFKTLAREVAADGVTLNTVLPAHLDRPAGLGGRLRRDGRGVDSGGRARQAGRHGRGARGGRGLPVQRPRVLRHGRRRPGGRGLLRST